MFPLIGCLWFIAWIRHTGKGVSSGLIRLQWQQAAWLIYRSELLHCLAFNETVIAPGQLGDTCVPNPGWPCVYVRVCRICNQEYNQFHINWPEADREKKMKDFRASKSKGKVAIAYNKDAGMRNETTLRNNNSNTPKDRDFQGTKTVSEKEIIPKRHSSGKKDSEWMRDRVRGRGMKSET